MEEGFSWRYAFALLVTITAAWLIWHGTRLVLTEPDHQRATSLMHVSLASPPAPPAPPKVVPKPPKRAVARQKVTRSSQALPTRSTNGPIVATNAPLATQTSETAVPAPATPANVSLQSTYIASIREAVEQQKRYPMSKDARLQQPQGTVTVWFILSRDGALVDSGIETSAGSLLDRAALESVHRASFPPFPPGLWPDEAQHRFTAYLRFTPQ